VAGSITPSVKGKNTLTLPLAVVQGWVDNPDTNQGIIIAYPSSTRGFNFDSREDTDPTRRPQLTLDLSPETTPPETTIASGPSGTISSGDVSFVFSSSEAGSTLECSLDESTFEPCSSPKEYADLSEGSHIFQVRAIDAAGNTDLTPASRTWTMDTTPPNITNVPSDVTKEATSYAGATVILTKPTANDPVDGNLTVSCSPDAGSTFPLGLTEVACSVSDSSGNTSIAKFNVTVLDTTAPNIASHDDITGVEATGPDGATS
jgi:large repetitive protein